jgi:carbamoyl-phosphate synthase large subunit
LHPSRLPPSFGLAHFKAQEEAQPPLPFQGTVFISVTDKEKPVILDVARKFQELGFRIKGTNGTHEFLRQKRISEDRWFKVGDTLIRQTEAECI